MEKLKDLKLALEVLRANTQPVDGHTDIKMKPNSLRWVKGGMKNGSNL